MPATHSKPTPHQIIALDIAGRNRDGFVTPDYFFPRRPTLEALARRGWLEPVPYYPGERRPTRFRLTDAGRAILATVDPDRTGEDLMIRALTK